MKDIMNLGGSWRWAIPGGEWQEKRVPSSYLCVGESVFERDFDWPGIRESGISELLKPMITPSDDDRVMLVFEGINYEGRVYFNGKHLGDTLAYCRYSYDITELLCEKNTVRVEVRDIGSVFGPGDGWCNYAGIVRDVSLRVRGATYIADDFFHAELDENYENAHAVVEVELGGNAAAGDVICELSRGGELVAEGSVRAEGMTAKVEFDLENAELWSPEHPFLYDLCTKFVIDGETVDESWRKVGFKSFEIAPDGRRFCLNGKPFFLRGVCRHDLMFDETVAFTQTDEQLEQDMRMIKSLGVNFVRLVHYPHDKRVVEMADRLGLLISEESGLWWSDMHNKQLTDSALEVMGRVMLRDRSNVSLAFWLAFNECDFTDEYLRDSVAVCRKYDPYRLISGANCMDYERTKRAFAECGVDFYTFHPYGSYISDVTGGRGHVGRATMPAMLEHLNDKPVVFTEWGGWYVNDNPALFKEFCLFMDDCYHGRNGDAVLAGMSYWAWADMYEYNRNDHACRDGIQIEGLVTVDRKPKAIYYAFHDYLSKGLVLHDETPAIYVDNAVTEPLVSHPFKNVELNPLEVLTDRSWGAWDLACEDARRARNVFNRVKRTVEYGPVLPEHVSAIGSLGVDLLYRPTLVCDYVPEKQLPGGPGGKYLYFIGGVLFAHGWPTYGKRGEHIADYVIDYADGSRAVLPLRNGIELTTVCSTFASTKIDPVVTGAKRAITFSYNKNAENYIVNIIRFENTSSADIESVTLRMVASDYCLLHYGISSADPLPAAGENKATLFRD